MIRVRYLKELVSSKIRKYIRLDLKLEIFFQIGERIIIILKFTNKSLGGGVLLELSHELDYLQWLFGDIVNISAKLRHHSKLKIDVEDTAYINLDISQKNKKNLISASLNLDFVRHDLTRTCTVICEKEL